MSLKPEDKARETIDRMLEQAGWHIYDIKEAKTHAHREVKTSNLKRVERLRQSILKKAFSGRLVPQEHNKETAGELTQ